MTHYTSPCSFSCAVPVLLAGFSRLLFAPGFSRGVRCRFLPPCSTARFSVLCPRLQPSAPPLRLRVNGGSLCALLFSHMPNQEPRWRLGKPRPHGCFRSWLKPPRSALKRAGPYEPQFFAPRLKPGAKRSPLKRANGTARFPVLSSSILIRQADFTVDMRRICWHWVFMTQQCRMCKACAATTSYSCTVPILFFFLHCSSLVLFLVLFQSC